ncbi:MAG TPA: EAL domain-containing protein [Pseudonocardiaceae bacterium]|nr:EAL domain-containing protein [Pseudonocardiaceae bacterium]
MTSPVHDDEVVSVRPTRSHPRSRRQRAMLARKWAYQVSTTTYIPLPYQDIEAELLALVDRLFDAVHSEPFCPEPAADVARRLVDLNCVGPTTFRKTVDSLGKALLGQPEMQSVARLPGKVVMLLGTLSASYAEAVRLYTLRQQDDMNRTLITLGRDWRLALRATEARLDAVLANTPFGVGIADLDGRFVDTNPALTDILGYSPTEFTERTLFDIVPASDEPFLRDACDGLLEVFLPRLRQRRRLLNKAGDEVPATLTVTVLHAPDRSDRFLLIVQDDSELNLLQRQLTLQSLHDVVTGLPNRQFFTTRLETTLHRADRAAGATVYHLGLDAFSMVADGFGRQVGDHLLKVVAERLKSVVAKEKAVVARLDGDEFGILVENSPTTPDIASMVDAINERLAEPVYLDGTGISVSTSIGVVHRPKKDVDPTELLRASDLALRRAKSRGRRQWELFDARQDADDRADFQLATTMPSAWELGEVRLAYRPLVELRGGRAIGVEAGLRWDHPRFGVLGHRRCVELAEQTGLMLSLGDWMLHSACAQVLRWRSESGFDLPLVLALSEGQVVDPDLVGRVLGILDAAGIEPAELRLGMPAHLLDGTRPEPVENLKVLAEAGVDVVLHGFGGAAGDLTCLADLPVRAVRISERLTSDRAHRATDPGQTSQVALLDRALTDLVALVHLAGGMVVVDGVHTRALADWWRHAGADNALGEHFPMPDGTPGQH